MSGCAECNGHGSTNGSCECEPRRQDYSSNLTKSLRKEINELEAAILNLKKKVESQ